MQPFEIFDLRERPQHADGVAGRIWNAFWKPHGTPYEQIRGGLAKFLTSKEPIPFALVAEIDGAPCGNCLVIENDEEARPDLRPWIAAVWVDEDRRGRGIAAALLEDGLRRCAALGVAKVYLVSRPAMRAFYVALGWTVLEEDVGQYRHLLYCRSLTVA